MKLLAVFLLSLPGLAADTEWLSAMLRARELQRSGKYAEAESILAGALALAEKSADLRLARSLGGLASVYQDLGRFGESEKLYRRAIAAVEAGGGSQDQSTIEPVNGLASLYYQTRRYAQAERLTLRCLALERQSLPQDQLAIARQLGNLAAVYQAERKYADAEERYRGALAIFERKGGPGTA